MSLFEEEEPEGTIYLIGFFPSGELGKERVPTIEETEELLKREEANRKMVMEQRRTAKYHAEARGFFSLRFKI